MRTECLCFVAFLLLGLAGCTSQFAHEQIYAPHQWGTGDSGRALRVRVAGQAQECTLARVAQSHAVSGTVAAMVNDHVMRDLGHRKTAVVDGMAVGQTRAQELDAAMQLLAQRGPHGVTEAELLLALNVLAADMGSPRAFVTLQEAHVWFATSGTPAPAR